MEANRLMTHPTIYDTNTAAAYLGISQSGIKKAIFRDKTLTEDGRIGRSPYFFQSTLDAYRGQPTDPTAPPPQHPLSTEQAAERMGLTITAFRQRGIEPDGRLINTLYYWPETLSAALAAEDAPQPDYTAAQACEYLGLPWPTLKHHIYHEKMLKSDYKRGRYIIFKKRTLDRFQAWYRKSSGKYASPA